MRVGMVNYTKGFEKGLRLRNGGGGVVAVVGCKGYSVTVAMTTAAAATSDTPVNLNHTTKTGVTSGVYRCNRYATPHFETLGVTVSYRPLRHCYGCYVIPKQRLHILKEVFCLGVTAGAYILTLFAMKYRERVRGLILVSPVCKAPSWTEWLYNKVLLNLLYFYGMCGLLKECLLHRYFSKELRSSMNGAESDVIQACRRVQSCGSLVTEEHPYAMLIPIEFFLMGFGLYRQQLPLSAASSNGSNPAKPPSLTYSCIAPELLSPESLGIKLKPIKTRATIEI
ncbi:hypothetical protein TEA_005515 [Camellia sinensis var. sinensis]|uniref:Pollen-specific protein SF21 n=1 Tax=Camellia sinensis var. sinensis TaxID=542762 RepID=A0A4S4E617_CAMSN|nr:hypothetical protein TEA_005515 [Camellia sinensis var. sinensis]